MACNWMRGWFRQGHCELLWSIRTNATLTSCYVRGTMGVLLRIATGVANAGRELTTYIEEGEYVLAAERGEGNPDLRAAFSAQAAPDSAAPAHERTNRRPESA